MESSQFSSIPPQQGESFLPGDRVAERFVVEKFMGVEIIGESYLARDEKENRQVTISIVPGKFVKHPSLLEKIKSEIKSASGVDHRNVMKCLGMGNLSDGSVYIVTEYVEGQKLYSILEKRREAKKYFSLKGASNLIAHLCNGLEALHKIRFHGSLSPFSIRISTAGRVKIADFPLSRLYYMFPVMRKEIPQYVQCFWAPEITKAGLLITERADIFSIGMVLFELLTSSLFDKENSSICAIRNDLPPEIDDFVKTCLNEDPSERWNNVTALKNALLKITEKHEEALNQQSQKQEGVDDNLILDLEVDVEKPMRKPPPPPPRVARKFSSPGAPVSASIQKSAGLPSQAGEVESHGESIPISVEVVEKAPSKPVETPSQQKRESKGLNLNEILASIDNIDAEKWMVTKDGLDHGPFRTREIVQMIMRWEIEGHHVIHDLEKGVRVKLRESEQFKDIVERARIEKQRKEELEALVKSEKAEKRSGVAKVFIALAAIGGIGVAIGLYFATRAAMQHFGGGREVNFDENIKINLGKGGILDSEKGKGHGGRRRGGGGGSGGLSYEEYMAKGVEIGDLGHDAGQVQLSQGQINAVMSSQGKKLYPCIYAELKKNPSLSKVTLKFAIEGKTGSVMGVTVTSGGSSEFQSCIASKMRGIKFPTFSAPRMGASFYFDVGR